MQCHSHRVTHYRPSRAAPRQSVGSCRAVPRGGRNRSCSTCRNTSLGVRRTYRAWCGASVRRPRDWLQSTAGCAGLLVIQGLGCGSRRAEGARALRRAPAGGPHSRGRRRAAMVTEECSSCRCRGAHGARGRSRRRLGGGLRRLGEPSSLGS